jgi:pseudaminic acid synthase
MKIADFDFSENNGVFIIAEMSANHNGSLQTALDTIKAAKRAGADAIKLQTYTPDTITLNVKKPDFLVKQSTIWDGVYLYDLYKQAFTPWEWHKTLFDAAQDEGLICFSSPFDFSAVDLLEELNSPAYKIASFEITDIPLIEYVASKGKPIIISTGIAELQDIVDAIAACKRMGNHDIILLKCTSSYPAPVDEANLRMIHDFQQRFNVLSGLSDHTLGITVPVLSVAMGARVIEKHFIVDKSIGGPDASFSLNENEFTNMVNAVREAEKAIGKVSFELSEKQKKSREHARSLYITLDINTGEELTPQNVRSVRPGFGLHPKYYKEILGKKAVKDLKRGEPLTWDVVK